MAGGLGTLVTSVPEMAFVMKLGGTAYLLYLAWQIAGASVLEQPDVARPLGLVQAAAFQMINPKAWIFALGAVTTFRPTDWPVVAGSVAVAITMMVVIIPSAAVWAGAGGVLSRHVGGGRAHRIVSVSLATLLGVTVVSVWI
jgi:threonine/homoserine/homoserine lactone efflux protein